MVYTLGESLLDIIFTSTEEITARPGGGMLNTAISLGRCGVPVSLISELGDDQAASTILEFLDKNKVNTKYIKKYYRQNTSVALAFLNEQKIPSFSIHKSYPPQRRLVSPESFSSDDVLFFGSLYSLDKEIRSQLKEILVRAKQASATICYDPNIRRHSLESPEIRQALTENISLSNLIKASEEDMQNIFGHDSTAGYARKIREINPAALFILTRGEKGAIGFDHNSSIDLPAKETELVSTIGAGDAFNAGIVYSMFNAAFPIKRVETPLEKMMKAGIDFSAAVCATLDNYVGDKFR